MHFYLIVGNVFGDSVLGRLEVVNWRWSIGGVELEVVV
jgi:hypothetical protein